MKLFRVTLQGPPVEWEWREAPDYYTKDGKRRDGVEAKKLVKPAMCFVELQADDEDAAKLVALRREIDAGYTEVVSVDQIG